MFRTQRTLDRQSLAVNWTRRAAGDYSHRYASVSVLRLAASDHGYRWQIVGGIHDGALMRCLAAALRLANANVARPSPFHRGERRERTIHDREPRPRRSRRPAYVTAPRGRSSAPKLAAVRVTAAAPAGILFPELATDRPAAYVQAVDATGAPCGHRSGPLALEAARRLAGRKARHLGLELEDLTT